MRERFLEASSFLRPVLRYDAKVYMFLPHERQVKGRRRAIHCAWGAGRKMVDAPHASPRDKSRSYAFMQANLF